MKRLVQFIILTLWSVICLIFGGCAVPPTDEVKPLSPLPTAGENVAPLSPLVSPTPFLSGTETPVVTPKPTLYLPTFTPTSNIPTATPTATATPNIPYEIEPDQQGRLNFTIYHDPNLEVTIPPVTSFLYTTAEIPYGHTTTLWLAEVGDITHQQIITSFSHFPPEGLVSPIILSPDGTEVVYLVGLGSNVFEGRLEALNLRTNQTHRLDLTAFIRRRGGKTILWKPDSSAIAYVEPTGELNLYDLATDQKVHLDQIPVISDTLPTMIEDIVLIGWLNPETLLYASREDGETWEVKAVNITTGVIAILATFETWDLTGATLSPNKNYILLSMDIGCPLLAINPQTQSSNLLTLDFSCGFRPVWYPDSNGVLGSYGDEIFAVNLSSLTASNGKEVSPTAIKIDDAINLEILSWSDEGAYFIYEDEETDQGILLSVETGQTQIIGPNFFEFVGWVYGE